MVIWIIFFISTFWPAHGHLNHIVYGKPSVVWSLHAWTRLINHLRGVAESTVVGRCLLQWWVQGYCCWPVHLSAALCSSLCWELFETRQISLRARICHSTANVNQHLTTRNNIIIRKTSHWGCGGTDYTCLDLLDALLHHSLRFRTIKCNFLDDRFTFLNEISLVIIFLCKVWCCDVFLFYFEVSSSVVIDLLFQQILVAK